MGSSVNEWGGRGGANGAKLLLLFNGQRGEPWGCGLWLEWAGLR